MAKRTPPDTVARFEGPTSKKRGGAERGVAERCRGWEGKGEEKERKGGVG